MFSASVAILSIGEFQASGRTFGPASNELKEQRILVLDIY